MGKNYGQAAQVITFKFTVKETKGKTVQKADELLFEAAGDKFCCRSRNAITDHIKLHVMVVFLVLTPIIKWILFSELLMTKS